MNGWLSSELKKEIRKVFEPRYEKNLSDKEVEDIAENLSTVTEEILKFKWKQKYEKFDI